MKLVRFGPAGLERPGLLIQPHTSTGPALALDVREMAPGIDDYTTDFFAENGLDRLRALLLAPNRKEVDLTGMRLGPPIARPGKIVCLGKNYADHAAEVDAEIPKSPIIFGKATSSVVGPFDSIEIPPSCRVVDSEVELAVVIGRVCKRVPESGAMNYVAGYTVLNDVTDRVAQKIGVQWFRGKSCDTFCPLGPYLVTTDEVPDPYRLELYSRLNGTILQHGNTSQMIFRIAYLISLITATTTLEPGDILSTGTPAGVGYARKPPILLKPGDQLQLGVESLGEQSCIVTAG